MKGNISGREGPPDIGVKGIDSSFHPYLTYWVGIGTNGTRQGLLALRDTCTYFPELSFCTTMLFLSTREPDVEGRTLLSVASGPPSNISKQSVSRTDELFPTHCPLSSSTRELGLSYFYVGCRDGRAGDEDDCLGCRKNIPSLVVDW